MLFAAREREPRSFHAPGIRDLHLGALDDEAARGLLEQRWVRRSHPRCVTSSSSRRAASRSFCSSFPPSSPKSSSSERSRYPIPSPSARTSDRRSSKRVRRLPEATQTFLLLSAADTADDMATVVQAASVLGIDASAVDAAEAASLVRVEGPRIVFHHPLVRSAVYDASGSTERRRVHRALADVLLEEGEPDRRAWHLAAAVLGHDSEIAGALERVAERARLRSGYATASRALERSAELTAEDESRALRLARAADDAWLAGSPDRALALLDAAAPRETSVRLRADIDHLRGTIELRCGVPARALTILASGAEAVASADPSKAIEMLVEAGQSASYAGDIDQIFEMGRRAERLVERGDLDETFTVDVLVGIGLMLSGETDRAAPLLTEAISLAERFEDPRRLVHAGASAGYLGLERIEYELHIRAVEQARTTGAVSSLPYALAFPRPGRNHRGKARGRDRSRLRGPAPCEGDRTGQLGLPPALVTRAHDGDSGPSRRSAERTRARHSGKARRAASASRERWPSGRWHDSTSGWGGRTTAFDASRRSRRRPGGRPPVRERARRSRPRRGCGAYRARR